MRRQAKCASTVLERRAGRLPRITATAKLRQKRVAEIDIGEGRVVQQAAQAERGAVLFCNDEPEAKAMLSIHFAYARFDIVARGLDRAHTAIADEFEPRGIVEQAENELGVGGREFAHAEPLRFKSIHSLDAGAERTLKLASSSARSSSSSRAVRPAGGT